MQTASSARRRAQTTPPRRSRQPQIETSEGRALLTGGTLDPTFGGTGIVTHDFGLPLTNTPPVAIQPWDGKAVVGLWSTVESALSLAASTRTARSTPRSARAGWPLPPSAWATSS